MLLYNSIFKSLPKNARNTHQMYTLKQNEWKEYSPMSLNDLPSLKLTYPLKIGRNPIGNFNFQPSIFRGENVSFREGNQPVLLSLLMSLVGWQLVDKMRPGFTIHKRHTPSFLKKETGLMSCQSRRISCLSVQNVCILKKQQMIYHPQN